MTASPFPFRFWGFPAWKIEDTHLSLVVIPDWGGKIASLMDMRRGREWLFTNPNIRPRRPEYGASYVREFDIGGFDECFPTVGACTYPTPPWQGAVMPDHGEVWALKWDMEQTHSGLRLSVGGRSLPYRMTKLIQFPGGGRLRLEYQVENFSDSPMPFIWSSHPLLNVRPRMELSVPTKRVRINSAPVLAATSGLEIFPPPCAKGGTGGLLGGEPPSWTGQTIAWPQFSGTDLSVIQPVAAGFAVKLFTEALAEGWVSLSDPDDGATFRFDFDPRVVTHVGLWLNYGGWAGVPGAKPYYNIGLEPCIGDGDSLAEVVGREGAHGLLAPGGEAKWWLEITLT